MVLIVLLVIVGIAAMLCLIEGIFSLLAASDENQLSEKEKIESAEDVV